MFEAILGILVDLNLLQDVPTIALQWRRYVGEKEVGRVERKASDSSLATTSGDKTWSKVAERCGSSIVPDACLKLGEGEERGVARVVETNQAFLQLLLLVVESGIRIHKRDS